MYACMYEILYSDGMWIYELRRYVWMYACMYVYVCHERDSRACMVTTQTWNMNEEEEEEVCGEHVIHDQRHDDAARVGDVASPNTRIQCE